MDAIRSLMEVWISQVNNGNNFAPCIQQLAHPHGVNATSGGL